MEKSKTLFTQQVKAGTRTIFIDLKENKRGGNYLTITQSKLGENDTYTRSQIILFQDDLARFSSALLRSLMQFNYLEHAVSSEYIEQVRTHHPNAYNKWTDEEVDSLKAMVEEGKDLETVATALKRRPGAIRYRLRQMGLEVQVA
jgi:hypothetical protein